VSDNQHALHPSTFHYLIQRAILRHSLLTCPVRQQPSKHFEISTRQFQYPFSLFRPNDSLASFKHPILTAAPPLGSIPPFSIPVYADALKKRGLHLEIPAEDVRLKIDAIIFNQLVNGIFTEESRFYFNEVMETFKARGCDAAVLGCTEIPLIVRADDAPLPTLDSTRLLARAALRKAVAPAVHSSMPQL